MGSQSVISGGIIAWQSLLNPLLRTREDIIKSTKNSKWYTGGFERAPCRQLHCAKAALEFTAGRLSRRCGCKGTATMPTKQRQSLMTVMAQATSPSPRLWPPETCDEHQSLTLGMSDSSDSLAQKDTPSTSGEKERAPWPVTLGTLLALQLGWGLWLMPAVYARSAYPSDASTALQRRRALQITYSDGIQLDAC